VADMAIWGRAWYFASIVLGSGFLGFWQTTLWVFCVRACTRETGAGG
jgi:hypothetical protein